eukprot:TRINITY_DN63033_c0_g1_i1.p1 TRINITY_DN63033_c0_g1~~TRINITY_DN63033_c0_g1_i1.p1  ORF type:complete len:438 (+),score=86.22 TRINITY_DN63033_c0_g1_i1:95-1315(+)
MPEEDVATMEQLIHEYGAYRLLTEGEVLRPGVGIGEGFPVTKAAGETSIKHRVLNNAGTELIFAPRVDISLKAEELMQEHGHIYGRSELAEDSRPTFRGLFAVVDRRGVMRKAEGDACVDLFDRVLKIQTDRFVPAASELFGAARVVPKMLFANLLLPGQEISMHHDVPEFRGIHPKTCPNWLQCVMHGSGLFERWRIRQCACLTYFQDMDAGSLAIYGAGAAAESGTVVAARRGLGVICEAETHPHHSDMWWPKSRRPGRLRPSSWPEKVRLRYIKGEEHWVVSGADGRELDRYLRSEVRVSTQMKLHCFKDAEEERRYLEHSDDLSVERVMELLTEDLRRRGRFDEEPPRSELAVMMVREYIHWPSPSAVAKCWASQPSSVFAQALAARSLVPTPAVDEQRARL